MIVSLKFRQDRRTIINGMMKKSELEFEYIDGIHGRNLNQSKYTNFNRLSLKHLSSGAIGCILSHAKAYKHIIGNSYKHTVIFEDDVILEENFKLRLTTFLNLIPKDFDILYLASNSSINKNITGWISDNIYIPLYPRSGQYAYIVSQKGARKILDNIFPVKIVAGGIDTLIGRLVSKGKLNAYHVYPSLCKADLDIESNIFNESKIFKKLHHTELN